MISALTFTFPVFLHPGTTYPLQILDYKLITDIRINLIRK